MSMGAYADRARARRPRWAAGTLSVCGLQVLRLLTRGLANKQIGRAPGISEATVTARMGSLFRRIGRRHRSSAAALGRCGRVLPGIWQGRLHARQVGNLVCSTRRHAGS